MTNFASGKCFARSITILTCTPLLNCSITTTRVALTSHDRQGSLNENPIHLKNHNPRYRAIPLIQKHNIALDAMGL
jgi:hypothetical protein